MLPTGWALVDRSMAPIIDALRKNIEAFVDSLSSGWVAAASPTDLPYRLIWPDGATAHRRSVSRA